MMNSNQTQMQPRSKKELRRNKANELALELLQIRSQVITQDANHRSKACSLTKKILEEKKLLHV